MRTEEEVANGLEQYGNMIRRICFVQLKKEADMEDVFQNVFFKYATTKTVFDSMEHEKAWMIRITMNECKSLLRRWFHRKVELSDDLSMYGSAPSTKDDTLLLEVLKLPDNHKNAIYLYYYEGYKVSEIANILKKNENTIHTWLKRGKEQLKIKLGGDYLG